MNSLRALSSVASRFCISLKVSASWPTSSVESTGIFVVKSPSATFSAACSRRRSRRAWARATSQPAASAAISAIRPAIRIWRRISATLASTSSRSVERTITQLGSPSGPRIAIAVSPVRSPVDPLDRARRPALGGDRGDGGRVVRDDRGPLDLRVADHERRLRPGRAGTDREHGDARLGPGRDLADQRPQLVLARAARHRILELRDLGLALGRELAELLDREVRAQLRDDVEVDEPDRRRDDDEEQQRQAVSDRAHGNNSTDILGFASGVGGRGIMLRMPKGRPRYSRKR